MSLLLYARKGLVAADGSPIAPPPQGDTQVVNYVVDAATDFANPERGWYVEDSSKYSFDGTKGNSAPVNGVAPGPTLQMCYVRLDAYRTTTTLPSSFLNNLAADMATWRNSGRKAVLRFAYNRDSSGADADIATMVGHIQQLAPLLEAYKDSIAVLQGGFVGAWGEQHSSSNGIHLNTTQRRQFIDAIMANTPNTMSVQFRTPWWMIDRYGADAPAYGDRFTGSVMSRLGHYNDCYGAGEWMATYWNEAVATQVQQRQYANDIGRTGVGGGETCDLDGLSAWNDGPYIIQQLELMGWDYMNSEFWKSMYQKWADSGHLAEISRRYGHRLALHWATLPLTAAPNASISIQMSVQNYGFGKVYNPRPIDLVLVAGSGTARTLRLTSDARRDLPLGGESAVLDYTVTLPADIAPGAYAMYLALPDPSANLSGDPRYSIRLANTGMWSASTGRNGLNATLTVVGGGEPPLPSGLIGVGSGSSSYADYPVTPNTTVGDYYVATNGSDSNNGTSTSTPFKTIAKALSSASAGQTILVRAGTYPIAQALNVNKANIKLFGYGSERFRLDRGNGGSLSDEVSRGILVTATGVHIKGFELTGVPARSDDVTASYAILVKAASAKIEDFVVHSGYTSSVCVYGANNALIQDGVSIGSYGAGGGTNRPDGFVVTANTSSVASAPRIVRCLAANSGDDCFDLFRATQGEFIDCVAIAPAYSPDGVGPGDGNAFKMGGQNSGVGPNNARGCIGLFHKAQGLNHNSTTNPGNAYLYNTIASGAIGIISDTGGAPSETRNNVIVGNSSRNGEVNVNGPLSNNLLNVSASVAKFADAPNGDYSLAPTSPAIGLGVGGTNAGASAVALALLKKWWRHQLIWIPGRGSGPGGTGLPGDTGGGGSAPTVAPTIVTRNGNANATIAWTSTPDGSYVASVERSTSPSSGFAQVGTAASTTGQYVDDGLTNGNVYYYRVRWTASAGSGPYSNVAHATPLSERWYHRGNPSFSASALSADAQTWHARLLTGIGTNAPYLYADVLELAEGDATWGPDLYDLGRAVGDATHNAILVLRTTGDLRFLDWVDRMWQLARAKLSDYDGDGRLGWVWQHDSGNATYYRKENHEQDAVMTHGIVALIAYTFDQNRGLVSPGGVDYGERADFWKNYLLTQFIPKWTTINGPGTAPKTSFINFWLTHPWNRNALMHHYLWRLTGNATYKAVADDHLAANFRTGSGVNLVEVSVNGGSAYVWRMGVLYNADGSATGNAENYLHESYYATYFAQDLVDFYMSNHAEVTSGRLTAVASAFRNFVFDNGIVDIASTIGGDVARGGIPQGGASRKSQGQYAYFQFHTLAPWDPTGRIATQALALHNAVHPDPDDVTQLNMAYGLLWHYLLGG